MAPFFLKQRSTSRRSWLSVLIIVFGRNNESEFLHGISSHMENVWKLNDRENAKYYEKARRQWENAHSIALLTGFRCFAAWKKKEDIGSKPTTNGAPHAWPLFGISLCGKKKRNEQKKKKRTKRVLLRTWVFFFFLHLSLVYRSLIHFFVAPKLCRNETVQKERLEKGTTTWKRKREIWRYTETWERRHSLTSVARKQFLHSISTRKAEMTSRDSTKIHGHTNMDEHTGRKHFNKKEKSSR